MEEQEQNKIQTLSALVSRALLSSKLGQQYGGDRKLYEALGYKEQLTFIDYFARYERQDMAKAIIDRPIIASWQGGFKIIEEDTEKKTALEKEWSVLDKKLKITSKLIRVDKLSGIGEYGILFLGFDDVMSVEQFKKPVKAGKRKLVYIKPFCSNTAKISVYVTNTTDKRYGLPLYYNIEMNDNTIVVHYTRVIHIIDDILENEVKGTPRLKIVFNRLMDLEKIVGGDAEMFWRGARPGYIGKVDKDFQLTETVKNDIKDQVDEFEHNLRRMLINEGIDYQALAQQIADPSNHVDIQIQMISAVTGIPKRILTGSERGELSSAQDKSEWLFFIQTRRETFIEQQIIRPLIEKLVDYQVLPKFIKEDFTIQWTDLFALSDKEKAEIGKIRTAALKEYGASPVIETIISPDMFLEYFLGLKPEQITMLQEARGDIIKNESNVSEEETEIIEEE